MTIFARCNPGVGSRYIKPGVVYEIMKERNGFYYPKEFNGHMCWVKKNFTVVSCPCNINNCIKHRIK
jgi:hypothetical protein